MFRPKDSDHLATALLCIICGAISLFTVSTIGSCFFPKKKSVLSHTPPTKAPTHTEAWTNATPNTPSLFAVLVTTNLVSQPCPCGFCNPARGLRVPEHINQIGYDLRIEISTNYLPIISLPKKEEREEEGGL